MSTFSHLNAGGEANMVDVSDKAVTQREATAEGYLYVNASVITQISEAKIAKGDVFAVARVAGIQGAKRCSDLIPLCHPLALSKVDINFDVDSQNSRIKASVVSKLPDVKSLTAKAHGDWVQITLVCEPETDPRPDVFELAIQNGWLLRELTQ
ncbi:MAG: cyclic pyranopterin monophosphate synthase MoaC [Pseudomonadota bacterium]